MRDKRLSYIKYIIVVIVSLTLIILLTTQLPKDIYQKHNPPSPSNTIDKSQILVYQNYTTINYSNLVWFTVTPSKSMLPFIDTGNYVLGINTTNATLNIGDVITYKNDKGDYIIHRIIDIKEDEDGIYYVLKGDNNVFTDPTHVRLNQTRYKIVGVVY